MTDQLEHELRSVLSARAAAVIADATEGEETIAQRLIEGDTAPVIEIAQPPTGRGRWILAAAAGAALVVGAAVLVLGGDSSNVRTGPVATNPPGSTGAVLEFRPVQASGTCATIGGSPAVFTGLNEDDCYELGGPLVGDGLVESVGQSASFSGSGAPCDGTDCSGVDVSGASTEIESFGVTLTLTDEGIAQVDALARECLGRATACPTGRLAIVVEGVVVAAPTVRIPEFDSDPLEIGGLTEAQSNTLALSLGNGAVGPDRNPPPAAPTDSPRAGLGAGAAKDLAEQVVLAVFGEDYITTEGSSDGSVNLVTLEGSKGTLVAEVGSDSGSGQTELIRIRPEAGPAMIGVVSTDRELVLQPPAEGELRYVVLDLGFEPLLEAEQTVKAERIDPIGPLPADAGWIAVWLTTPDGQLLQWLEPIN